MECSWGGSWLPHSFINSENGPQQTPIWVIFDHWERVGAPVTNNMQHHASIPFLPPFKLPGVQRSPLLCLDWFFFQHKCSGSQVCVFTCISCVSTRHNCNQCDVRHLFVTILLWMLLMSAIIFPLTRIRSCQRGSGSGSDAGADLSFGISK